MKGLIAIAALALAVTASAGASDRSSVRHCPSVLGGTYYNVTVRNISCPVGRFVIDTFDGTEACSRNAACVLVFHDTSRAGRRFRVRCSTVGGLGETVIIERCVFLADVGKPVAAQQAARFYIAP